MARMLLIGLVICMMAGGVVGQATTPGSNPGGSTNGKSEQKDSPRGLPHVYLFVFGSFDWGRYGGGLGNALSNHWTTTLGFGFRFSRLAVSVSGLLGGKADLSGEHLGRVALEAPDTTFIRPVCTSIDIGFSVLATEKLRLTPLMGFKWNSVDPGNFVDPDLDLGHTFGVKGAILFEYNIGRKVRAGDTERTHHYLFLSLSASHWNYDGLGFGSGTLWGLSIGYILDIFIV